MASTTAFCTSAKKELFDGTHSFLASGGDTFKGGLFTNSATLGASTNAYSTTNEISGTGYTAGGATLTNVNPTSSGTTAFIDFNDLTWSSATFTARTLLNYNSTDSNTAISVHDFGGDVSVTSGTFTAQFPTADASNAVLRIS